MMVTYITWLRLVVTSLTIVHCNANDEGNENKSRSKGPNIVLFLADDMGYGDIKSDGHPTQEPTFVDWMVDNGLKFTHWYNAATLCAPSRAALLTGRQPDRVGIKGDDFEVFFPCHTTGLPRSEITIAEALKDAGYTTGMVGKWHQGINRDNVNDGYHLPRHHGFDFVGTTIPFTLHIDCDTAKVFRKQPRTDLCFIYHDTTLIEQPIHLERLTGRVVHDAQAFLHNQTGERPFFLYVSLPQTHSPMFNIPQFQNVSKRGVYGDQLLEMSWAMEEIYSTLRNLQFDENTLSIFLSDHGPHLELCGHGGVSGPLRGGKTTYRDGGLRVPAVVHWPAAITKPRVSDTVISTMDIFPTLMELTGGKLPQDRKMDGLSFADLLSDNPKDNSPIYDRKLVYFVCQNLLIAVRYKQYKIYYRMSDDVSEDQLKNLCTDDIGQNVYVGGEDCKDFEVLEKEIVYDILEDEAEKRPLPTKVAEIIVNEIADEVQQYMSSFEDTEELLLQEKCIRSLIPCCNPPYCICKNGDMPKTMINV